MTEIEFKNEILAKKTAVIWIYGIITSGFSLISFIQSKNNIIVGLCLLLFISSSVFLLSKYLSHVKLNREATHKQNVYNRAFEGTHFTWHQYNMLMDDIMDHYDATNNHKLLVRLNKIINSSFQQLQKSLKELYKDGNIYYSFKQINYKTDFTLERKGKIITNDSYKKSHFIIFNDNDIRDSYSLGGDCVEELDFDPNTIGADAYAELTQSLFFKCIHSGKIQFSSKYTPTQQKIGNYRYKSGFVAPILLFGVPFALACFGSPKEGFFNKDVYHLVATFSDSVSELIRMMIVYESLIEARLKIEYKDPIGKIEGSDESEPKEIA
jgi:hypothetical protein